MSCGSATDTEGSPGNASAAAGVPGPTRPEGGALGTMLFGGAVVLVLAALPVLGLFVALSVWRGKRAMEIGFLGFVAALLFATVPLRNFLPGSPPPGSWVDAAVVLWAIAGLTLALLFIVLAWWREADPET